MTRRPCPRVAVMSMLLLCVCATGSAWALVVSDSATTARHAVTAALKNDIVAAVLRQRDRLAKMASRLGALVSVDRYRIEPPRTMAPATDAPLPMSISSCDGKHRTRRERSAAWCWK